MALRVLSASTAVPVTTADLHTHLRSSTADTSAIEAYRAAAVEYCETVTRRTMLETSYRLTLDEWPAVIELPRVPLTSSTTVSVSYRAQGSTTYTALSGDTIWVDAESEPARVTLRHDNAWPDTTLSSVNGVRVDFTAGSTAAADVPDSLKQAVRLLVGHWYENRETVVVGTAQATVAKAVDALLWSQKVPEVP